jgi:hypothetical protein
MSSTEPAGAQLVARVQRGLEGLYRCEAGIEVAEYLLDEAARGALQLQRLASEQLLLSVEDGELSLGLFLDPQLLVRLGARDPSLGVDDSNLADLCHAIEGVSHFLLVATRAQQGRPVSALELELQAEVDKYVTCHLMGYGDGLREQLFERSTLLQDLSAEERERYRMANDCAYAYTGHLERRYVRQRRLDAMLLELRRFWRAGLHDKLRSIRAATH